MPIEVLAQPSGTVRDGQIDLSLRSSQQLVALTPLQATTSGLPADDNLDDIWLSRQEWGANPATSTTSISDVTYEGVIIHHTAGGYTFNTRAAQIAHMVALQTDAVDGERDFVDIPYNFMFFADGTVGEARSWNTRAASTFGDTYIAFCFVGNYVFDELTEVQISSFHRVRNEFLRRSPQATSIAYHQAAAVIANTGATACPGGNIINWIEAGLPGQAPAAVELPTGKVTVGTSSVNVR